MRRRWFAILAFLATSAWAGDATSDPAEIVKALAAQVDAHPDDLDARVRLGDAYLAAHDVSAADRCFLAVLEKSANHAGALFGRGRAARDRGWWSDAAKFFRRSIDADPHRDPARTWALLLHALSRTGETDAATKASERALALPQEQQDGTLFAVAAESACDRGDLKRAMEIAETGCSRFPGSPWAWSENGWLLDRQDRAKEAAAAFKRIAVTSAEVRERQRTSLTLPVKSRCRIVRAPHGKASQPALPYRFACDFEPINEHGKAASAKGERNEEFFGWGAPVVAAADGVVVDVRDGVPDHDVSAPDTAKSAGNFVYVEHAPGEITRYFHLQKGSVVVKVGERVKGGAALGRIGDSGASGKPMLGFALVRDRAPTDESRAFVFAKYVRIKKSETIDVVDGCPEEDQWVEPGS